MDNYSDCILKIKSFSESEKEIMGALILGSQVRKDLPGDRWSDLDILLLVNDTSKYTDNNDWVNKFGNMICMSNEIINLSWINLIWHVKRILYSDGRAIDFSIEPYDKIDDVLEMNKEIHSIGYQIIFDRTNGQFPSKLINSLKDYVKIEKTGVSEKELNILVNDILFQVIYAIKKIKQGELWVATNVINCVLKDKLLQLIEIHNYIVEKKSNIIMYEGRFLERRTNAVIQKKIENCFSHYNNKDAVRTLDHLIDFIEEIYNEIASVLKYDANKNMFKQVRIIFNKIESD